MLGSDHRLQFELFQRLRLVEVVLAQEWHDLEPPDPFQLLLVQVRLHEERVADLEALAQTLFGSYLPVQGCQQIQDYAGADPGRVPVQVAGQDLCAGRELYEREPSPQCVVDQGDASISRIHRAEKVDVVWKLEPFAAVGEEDVVVAILEHEDELAEDP